MVSVQPLHTFFSATSRLILMANILIYIGPSQGSREDFLRDTIYSIQSALDKGFLTVRESQHTTYKTIQPERWVNEKNQKWMVFDFNSLGLYDFTPVIFNTTDNVVTYESTRNIYTYKRQWNLTLVTADKYHVKNPECGWCLTNVGSYKEVTEDPCHERLQVNQLWKFRILPKEQTAR